MMAIKLMVMAVLLSVFCNSVETRGLTLDKNVMMEMILKLITASPVKKLFVVMDLP